jgi:hypothetical protein
MIGIQVAAWLLGDVGATAGAPGWSERSDRLLGSTAREPVAALEAACSRGCGAARLCVMDVVALAGVGVALVSVVTTAVLAIRAQRSLREERDDDRRWQASIAYRTDQTQVVEQALQLATDLLNHVYAIEFHWRRSGPKRTEVAEGSGPGSVDDPPESVTDFYGTNMASFHAQLNKLQIAAYRVESSSFREATLRYAADLDGFRHFKTLDEGASLLQELQRQVDLLLEAGGEYIRGMFRVYGQP